MVAVVAQYQSECNRYSQALEWSETLVMKSLKTKNGELELQDVSR